MEARDKEQYKARAHAMWNAFGALLVNDPVYARHEAWAREQIDALVEDGYLPTLLFERDTEPSSYDNAEGAIVDWEGAGVELVSIHWTGTGASLYGDDAGNKVSYVDPPARGSIQPDRELWA
jgi:hypothetical protein